MDNGSKRDTIHPFLQPRSDRKPSGKIFKVRTNGKLEGMKFKLRIL